MIMSTLNCILVVLLCLCVVLSIGLYCRWLGREEERLRNDNCKNHLPDIAAPLL